MYAIHFNFPQSQSSTYLIKAHVYLNPGTMYVSNNWDVYTQLKNRCRVKSINHWRCDPMVLWEAWILASILSPVHITVTQHALIYSLNYLEKKIFWISRNETQQQTCPCHLPRVPLCRIVHRLHVSPDDDFSNRCTSYELLTGSERGYAQNGVVVWSEMGLFT